MINMKQLPIELCSIVNVHSGNCSEDCAFCAQSKHHTCDIEKYDTLPQPSLLKQARLLAEKGVSYFSLVASGREPSQFLFEYIIDTVKKIKQAAPRLKVCVSLGFLTKERARALALAGVSRYHHNLETGPSFFNKICTSHTYAERINTLEIARQAGLELCCGGIIGLGESEKDRIEMFNQIQELNIRSIPINILHAVEETPLAQMPLLSKEEIVKTIGFAREINPAAKIRIAGGRDQFEHAFVLDCVKAGADALMTGNYLTTKGFSLDQDLKLLNMH
ncbi:biotin synthase BioB [Marispirochaeta sp.]|jgi:biotin synthase|uniref:biotin synthase BioB n=1 Tax=Marispirochaeta sp. TaxID=2038653 RepID=UPI0029C614E6|nr:biotin synthase BioB [Marispirochaeta sp.]